VRQKRLGRFIENEKLPRSIIKHIGSAFRRYGRLDPVWDDIHFTQYLMKMPPLSDAWTPQDNQVPCVIT
jgi:hypothetical protein